MLDLLALGLVLAPSGPWQAPAEPADPAVPFELTGLPSPAGPDSALPNLALGADGRVRLTWIDREPDEVSVLRFATLGEAGWSAPREIVRGGDLFINWADVPSIAALESGVLMAHWLRDAEADYSYDAEFALSSDDGATWSEPRTLHDHTGGGEHGFVSIVPWDTDSFGAIWLDGRDMVDKPAGEGEMALMFRTSDAAGVLGAEQVIDPRVCSCCQTSLVGLPGDIFWATYRGRSSGEVRDIHQAVWTPFVAEGWLRNRRPIHDDGWRIEGCPVNGPRAAILAKGTTASAWFTGVGEDGGEVRLAIRSEDGSYAAPIRIDEGSAVGRVDVLWVDDQSVVVTWLEDVGSAQAEWRAMRVSSDGPMGPPIVIDTVPHDRTTGFLRMAPSGDDLILGWTAAPEQRGGERRVVTARLRVSE